MNIYQLSKSFSKLNDIVAELRQKCPWDRKQTLESLRHLTIEETYELSEAILNKDMEEIQKELGDLLLHVLFYARIGSEKGAFTLEEVMTSLTNKLIRRHPHIYGEVKADTAEEVTVTWEEIKAKEKAEAAKREHKAVASTLDGVPSQLPSLIKAQRMQEKAASVGFDWNNEQEVWEKVKEEINEFEMADSHEEKTSEMGDLLFSLVNYCRFKGINADEALSQTNKKFKERFMHIEAAAIQSDKKIGELTLEEMEQHWQQAKQLSSTK